MLEGTIVFRLSNVGSKSEGVYPYIESENEIYTKIRLKGENPFENAVLKEHEGKKVSIEGSYNDNKTFIGERMICGEEVLFDCNAKNEESENIEALNIVPEEIVPEEIAPEEIAPEEVAHEESTQAAEESQ